MNAGAVACRLLTTMIILTVFWCSKTSWAVELVQVDPQDADLNESDESDDPIDRLAYCPSWCDEEGNLHMGYFCTEPFCCIVSTGFLCCTDGSLRVNSSIHQDNHNCEELALSWFTKYWRVILGVCLPLGIISLIVSMGLCGYQHIKIRRQRRQRRRGSCRSRSASGVSSCSMCSGCSHSSRCSRCSRSSRGSLPSLPPAYDNPEFRTLERGAPIVTSQSDAVALPLDPMTSQYGDGVTSQCVDEVTSQYGEAMSSHYGDTGTSQHGDVVETDVDIYVVRGQIQMGELSNSRSMDAHMSGPPPPYWQPPPYTRDEPPDYTVGCAYPGGGDVLGVGSTPV